MKLNLLRASEANVKKLEEPKAAAEAFMAAEADGVCVSLEAYLNSVDGSVEGLPFIHYVDQALV